MNDDEDFLIAVIIWMIGSALTNWRWSIVFGVIILLLFIPKLRRIWNW